MTEHLDAYAGHVAAITDKAQGLELPCYVGGYPSEFVRVYCAAFGYLPSGRRISKRTSA